MMTLTSLGCLLASIVYLSNASKVEKDRFAFLTQSYISKCTHVITLSYLAYFNLSLVTLALITVYGIDAYIGLYIVFKVFASGEEYQEE